MKILNITKENEEIIVEVEGYPHAQPVFPADITEAELKTKLQEWKTNQDEVDEINRNRKKEKKTETETPHKKLIGKNI